MARKKNSNNTKDKILIAAKEIFIEYGYENAKVNEIASRADVTKTMLYYHYKSKENMLNEIIAQTLEMIVQELERRLKTIEVLDKEAFKKYINDMVSVWQENKDMVKLILAQTMKDDNSAKVMIAALQHFYDEVLSIFGQKGYEIIGKDKARIRVFFFNTMPMVMYSVLSDTVANESNLEKDLLREEFVNTFSEMFFQNIELK